MATEPLSYEELVEVIGECAGVRVAADAVAHQPEVTFAELGIDSLGVLGVVAALENRYRVRLGEQGQRCERPSRLRALVNGALVAEEDDARTH